MNKLAALFKVFKKLIKDPSSLSSVLHNDYESDMKKYIEKKHGIAQLPTIDINTLFPLLSEEINNYTFLEGTSAITDIVLLKQLARRYPHCNYLEIGSWRGESIYNVAQVADKCTSVTLSGEEMKALNYPEGMVELDGFFSNNVSNIEKIEHNSLTYDFSHLKNKYDLIFVDGDHAYKVVKADTSNMLGLLKNDSSVLVWHDYGFGFEKIRYSVLAGILDGVPPELHKYLYHVSNTMCAILIKNEFETYFTKYPTTPNKSFTVKITTGKISA